MRKGDTRSESQDQCMYRGVIHRLLTCETVPPTSFLVFRSDVAGSSCHWDSICHRQWNFFPSPDLVQTHGMPSGKNRNLSTRKGKREAL